MPLASNVFPELFLHSPEQCKYVAETYFEILRGFYETLNYARIGPEIVKRPRKWPLPPSKKLGGDVKRARIPGPLTFNYP